MSGTFRQFKPSGSRSRLRISGSLISALGWDSVGSSFDCYGIFRSHQELLCAPVDFVVQSSNEHPFVEVIGHVQTIEAATRSPTLRDIPRLRDLVMSDRLVRFSASWTNESRSQLDLNLGADVADRLGWTREPDSARPLYVCTHGGILIAVSEQQYIDAMSEDPLR